ncbi:MAG: molybdate ABC transporter substrate-binding protein [Kangiellaceae bacterium]|nr:molybdate ABC transporter substrate-binding protein [Kangiellaceae bacterium]MCW9000340.1 molybdate ABC transporter substrate-binding protein [Kangiellaceae bacterium]MCW9017836.1 molybdate ABC transporter substrate-binding protein [Kangiellaceae bacterium]
MFRSLSLILIICFSNHVWAEKIKVAVASNFMVPMKAIASEFEKETGHKVVLSFGSSGKIFAQIRYGAPFQLFFSADQAKPIALQQAGNVVAESRFTYAIGTLVLWSTNLGLSELSQDVLVSEAYNKLALANPKLAPYGTAAAQVLDNLKLGDDVKKVYGENIAQTFQYVLTGNADLGFVAKSQLIALGQKSKNAGWEVPQHLHSPIKQDVVLLRRGENSVAAKAFLKYVKSDKIQKMIESYGYQTSSTTEIKN